MAGKAAGGADGGPVRAQAPPAVVDSKEQRRPSATRHSLHLRPGGGDGGAAGDRAHLRGGPAATAVWLPSRVGRQNSPPSGLLARDAAWATGGGRCGFARLLHFNPALALDALPVPPHRRWAF